MARTFADLIKTVSRNVGDLYESTLTGATNATTLLDSSKTQGDGWWTGANLALTSGSQAGQERSVTAWAQSGGTYTTEAFPGTPSASDAYELRRRPKHTRVVVKEFINQAVREIEKFCWVQVDSRADLADTTVYALNKTEYAVPASMEMVHRVLFMDIQSQPQTTTANLPVSGNVGDYFYKTDTQTVVEWSGSAWVASTRIPWQELDQDKWETNGIGSILIQTLDDYVSWDTSGPPISDASPLRFIGSKRPTEFVNDSDTNPYEGNYLEVYASARLCLRLAEGAQDEADFMAKFKTFYGLEADAFRGTRRGLPSGSRKVR